MGWASGEQGAFLSVMRRHKSAIENIGWETLQHHCGADYDNALVCHFAGIHKKNMKEYTDAHLTS